MKTISFKSINDFHKVIQRSIDSRLDINKAFKEVLSESKPDEAWVDFVITKPGEDISLHIHVGVLTDGIVQSTMSVFNPTVDEDYDLVAICTFSLNEDDNVVVSRLQVQEGLEHEEKIINTLEGCLCAVAVEMNNDIARKIFGNVAGITGYDSAGNEHIIKGDSNGQD